MQAADFRRCRILGRDLRVCLTFVRLRAILVSAIDILVVACLLGSFVRDVPWIRTVGSVAIPWPLFLGVSQRSLPGTRGHHAHFDVPS